MANINSKAQAIIDAIPQIISDHHIDQKAIQSAFDLYCQNWKIEKRKIVVFESNLEGWKFVTAKTSAARDAALENSCQCEKEDCKICIFKNKEKPLTDIFKNGGFIYWVTPNEIIVILSPKIYHTQGRLHREDGPALEWPTEKYWFLHGVKLEENMYHEIMDKKMSFKEIMSLENMEHRMIALKYMEPKQLLKDSGVKIIDKSNRGNELWIINNKDIFPQAELFLKYGCPSTERIYMKCVEREWALLPDGNLSAYQAQAKSHCFTLEEYMSLEVEG